MRVVLTDEPFAAVCMFSPYDRDFVDQFKSRIPYEGRAWDAGRKRWIISADYAADLLTFLASIQADIVDKRQTSSSEGTVGPAMPDELRTAFDTLYLAYTAPLCIAEASYKALAQYRHPDKGGSATEFFAIATAIRVIRSYLLDPRPVAEGDDDDVPF